MARYGGWIQTFTGRKFYPLDPKPEDVDIRDIAHALSLQCRFSGHTRRHYSVAEHRVRGSFLVPPHLELAFLLHDASEAYLVDIPRPLKQLPEFLAYRKAERVLEAAVRSAFGVPSFEQPEIERADLIMLSTEARDLLGPKPADWGPLPDPLPQPIRDWDEAAISPESAFLRRFFNLTRGSR